MHKIFWNPILKFRTRNFFPEKKIKLLRKLCNTRKYWKTSVLNAKNAGRQRENFFSVAILIVHFWRALDIME